MKLTAVLFALSLAACSKDGSLPAELGNAAGVKALVKAVEAKLGSAPAFDRLAVGRVSKDIDLYVVDPKDKKKLLAYDVKDGALEGPKPVTRVGDTESALEGHVMTEADLAGLDKVLTACPGKSKGKTVEGLRYSDGYDMVHHEQGPPGWVVKTAGGYCMASLAGEITYAE